MQNQDTSLPNGPLIAWFGDDFTGASAVMEVLSFAGLPSILFLEPPTQEQLALFPDLKGIGIASTARALSPAGMAAELPPAFTCLKALNPQIMHYKICSTLDSSPTVGSIGKAIEIGSDIFGPDVVPILVAAPQMRRYQRQGELFAGLGDAVYRLDEHPVMSRHPVTPMDEPNVAKHIARQSTRLSIGCLSKSELASNPEHSVAPEADISAVTLDCDDGASETDAGRFLWENRDKNSFVVGSQGVEYALVRHWQAKQQLHPQEPAGGIGFAGKMVVVSGSVSPTTAEQIAWSKANGFDSIEFDAPAACRGPEALEKAIDNAVSAALIAFDHGLTPMVHTAEGPDDPAVERFTSAVSESTLSMDAANQLIGEALGKVLSRVLSQSDARRVVISGGDTSGHATRQLGIYALSALAPTIPGAAIFKAHADGAVDGLELALKGGQMGSKDYFGWVRAGGGVRSDFGQ